MAKLICIAALAAGIVLIYLGYQRQQSVAGKVDNSLSQVGQKLDGEEHATTQVKYYVAGGILAVVGLVGLGASKK